MIIRCINFYDKVKIVYNQIKVKERSKQIHVTVTHPNITSGLLGDCITSPLSVDAASLVTKLECVPTSSNLTSGIGLD